MTRVTLVKKEEIATDTISFFFTKPESYQYQAGQFTEITLLTPPEEDRTDTVREFTIASAPHEQYLMFTMRLRGSAFKKALTSLPLGGQVEVDIPYGNFVLPDDTTRPIVMLAGGIGITPFRSMVIQTMHTKRERDVVLFSFHKTVRDAVFLQELLRASQSHRSFTFVPVLTREPDWSGERGHVRVELIRRFMPVQSNTLFYLGGSGGFLAAVSQTLKDAGITSSAIVVDEFAGY